MSITRRNWQARWIWAPDARTVNAHVLFRADFNLDHPGGDETLYIAAESFAIVYINGKLITQTSSLSYPTQHYYERCAVGEHLRPGVNSVAVLAWWIGIPSGASCPKDPGLLFELVDREGRLILGSDDPAMHCRVLDAWQGRQRRSLWLNLDLIETLDLRRLPAEFPMLDPETMDPVEVQGSAKVRYADIQLRDFPKPGGEDLATAQVVFAGEIADRSAGVEIAHVAVAAEQNEVIDGMTAPRPMAADFTVPALAPGRAWSVLVDLGDYEKGLPQFTIGGCEDASVDVSWFEDLEKLAPGETVAKVYVTDRYILPEREVDIRPEEWKCGRFLRLTFRNAGRTLRVSRLRWQRQHYPLGRRLRFASSDKRLERIVEIGLKAAALCMHDNIMDCPWRERRQWIGDAQRIALLNHYAFGDRRLVRAVLGQHAYFQDVNGRMYSCLPIYEEYPTQSMEWFRAVMEYGRYTGDASLLEQVADNVEMLHRWFLRPENRDGHGLLRIVTQPIMNWMDNPFGSLIAPDGAAPKPKASVRSHQFRTAFSAMNLRYLLFLDDVAEAMASLDRPWVVEQARGRRAELERIIPEVFMQADTGLLRNCAESDIEITYAELTHALAVLADLPGVDGEALWQRYRSYEQAAGASAWGRESGRTIVKAGPFGKFATLEALGRLGRRDELVEEILQCWGPMVDAGADASWEHFSPNASHCHGWGGAMIVSLARHVFGLDARRGGKSRVENLAGTAWMECEIDAG